MAHCQWPMDLVLSHDIICISRSDDNRRKLPLAVLMAHCQWPMDLELSHDIICISRSDDNRRSCRSHLDVFHHIYSLHDFIFSTKATATAAISCLFVYFVVLKIKKIRVHSCPFVVLNQWLKHEMFPGGESIPAASFQNSRRTNVPAAYPADIAARCPPQAMPRQTRAIRA